MGSGCDASDRDVWKVEGMMGTAPESAGSVRTCSHEVRKTREYLPSDRLRPTAAVLPVSALCVLPSNSTEARHIDVNQDLSYGRANITTRRQLKYLESEMSYLLEISMLQFFKPPPRPWMPAWRLLGPVEA
jgi:hypothetical protein